eukprot:11211058-Lingulodinium_polyedra.AAC.1
MATTLQHRLIVRHLADDDSQRSGIWRKVTPSIPSRAFACASGVRERCSSVPVLGKTVQLLGISYVVSTMLGQ